VSGAASARSDFDRRLRRDAALCLAALLVLGLNIGAAFLPLGSWHGAVTLGLCLSQGLLILLFWMELQGSGAMIRWCVILPAAWLVLLIGLTWADIATRAMIPPPW
jgi:cytochrome c oxidase subunit 4